MYIRNLSTAKTICIVLFLAARLRLSKFSVKKIVANKRLYLSRQKNNNEIIHDQIDRLFLVQTTYVLLFVQQHITCYTSNNHVKEIGIFSHYESLVVW